MFMGKTTSSKPQQNVTTQYPELQLSYPNNGLEYHNWDCYFKLKILKNVSNVDNVQYSKFTVFPTAYLKGPFDMVGR